MKYTSNKMNFNYYDETLDHPIGSPLSDSERLEICVICRNRSFDKNVGTICGRTFKKPDFDNSCPFMIVDEKENERREARKAAEQARYEEDVRMCRGVVRFLLRLLARI